MPLLAAYLLLSPVQAFLQETHFGRYHGSFLASIPLFFQAEWADLREGPAFPLVVPWAGHLWFLVFLLWFSLAGLPLLALLRRPRGRRLVAWLGQHADRRGAVLWWAVPLALVHTALRAAGPVEHGWGEFVVFFDLLVAGAVLVADQRLVGAVRRELLPALYVAVAGTLVLGAAAAAGWLDRWPGDRSYSWTSVGLYSPGWRWTRCRHRPRAPRPAATRPDHCDATPDAPWPLPPDRR